MKKKSLYKNMLRDDGTNNKDDAANQKIEKLICRSQKRTLKTNFAFFTFVSFS